MKPEQEMWEYLKDKVNGIWDADRIENRLNRNFPDISWGYKGRNGYIENKAIAYWPSKLDQPVKIKSLTDGQRGWLHTRGEVAGNIYLLLRVGGILGDIMENSYYIYDWTQVWQLGTWTKDQMIVNAILNWRHHSFDQSRFLTVLRYGSEAIV